MADQTKTAAPSEGAAERDLSGPPASTTGSCSNIEGGSVAVQSDIDEALEFLRRHARGGPMQLHAIEANGGGIETRTFPTEEGRRSFLEKWCGRRNLYFTVNPLKKSAPPDRKPTKTDIAALAWCHVDIDPVGGETPEAAKEHAMAALRAAPWASEIIDSGGGIQAFWRLRGPIPVGADIDGLETVNKALATRFGGDHCHNIDRIMRVPGTINLPGAKKIAKGRKVCAATLLHIADFAYDLTEIQSL